MLQETKSKAKRPAAKQQGKASRQPSKASQPSKAAKQASTTSKTVRKSATASKKSHSLKQANPISPEQRQSMIEVAAYYIAEREGFSGHTPVECWLTAEAEIDRQLLQQSAK